MANALYSTAPKQNIFFTKESFMVWHCSGVVEESVTQGQAGTWDPQIYRQSWVELDCTSIGNDECHSKSSGLGQNTVLPSLFAGF